MRNFFILFFLMFSPCGAMGFSESTLFPVFKHENTVDLGGFSFVESASYQLIYAPLEPQPYRFAQHYGSQRLPRVPLFHTYNPIFNTDEKQAVFVIMAAHLGKIAKGVPNVFALSEADLAKAEVNLVIQSLGGVPQTGPHAGKVLTNFRPHTFIHSEAQDNAFTKNETIVWLVSLPALKNEANPREPIDKKPNNVSSHPAGGMIVSSPDNMQFYLPQEGAAFWSYVSGNGKAGLTYHVCLPFEKAEVLRIFLKDNTAVAYSHFMRMLKSQVSDEVFQAIQKLFNSSVSA